MAESRAHMIARLRAMRKKHHLGEFKTGSRKPRIHRHRKTTQVRTMARRRKTSRRSSSKMDRSVWKNVIGVGGYILFESLGEPILAQWIPNQYLDIAELGLGIWLSKKGGIVGDVAKAAIYINSYTLLKKYVSPMVNGMAGMPN